MSHTNSTTNYNLPQFIGTDQPAWLTDINGAFSAIDTAVKNASDAATTAGADATTANTSIGTLASLNTTEKTNLVGAINEVNTNVGTAQNTANGAATTANNTATALNNFEKKFNLTDITSAQIPAIGNTDSGTMTLAQNSDGSIFKCYGSRSFFSSSVIQFSAIPGLTGYYGADTGLILNTAPTEAYIIKNAGIRCVTDNADNNVRSMSALDFAVGTNGHVYVYPKNASGNITVASGIYARWMYNASLYFNLSFGDEPTPEA